MEGEREDEKHPRVEETWIDWLPLAARACNPGICADGELNQWPFGSQVDSPLSHTSRGENMFS